VNSERRAQEWLGGTFLRATIRSKCEPLALFNSHHLGDFNMRKVLIVVAAIAAASCGGNSSNLSKAEAQSVASEIAAALQSHEAVASSNQLSFGGSSSVTRSCAGGGTLTVDGSLSVNCPSGLRSCTTAGSLTVDADQCVTSAGATIDGTVTTTVTGIGLSFIKKVTGELTIKRPDGTTETCAIDVTLMFGRLSGSVCGVSVSK